MTGFLSGSLKLVKCSTILEDEQEIIGEDFWWNGVAFPFYKKSGSWGRLNAGLGGSGARSRATSEAAQNVSPINFSQRKLQTSAHFQKWKYSNRGHLHKTKQYVWFSGVNFPTEMTAEVVDPPDLSPAPVFTLMPSSKDPTWRPIKWEHEDVLLHSIRKY